MWDAYHNFQVLGVYNRYLKIITILGLRAHTGDHSSCLRYQG